MLILLPPSETKHERTRGRSMDLGSLSFPSLTATREQVAAALAQVSAAPDATSRLGVSPGLADDVARNTRLSSAPAVPAAELYTGVLYDALDLGGLDSASRRRATRRIVVVSALYGALRLNDKVAPYRASMAVNLPGVGPLAGAWRAPLADALGAAAGRGLILDARSSTYVAAWQPNGDQAQRWVQIRVPGATHMAKHTRGLVAAALCRNAADPRRPEALLELLGQEFEVSLTEPTHAGRPWILDALARDRP